MSSPTRALARRVIELACRAPSVHNTQPWRWRVVDGTAIELRGDQHRQLLVSDPCGRNLAISCGVALHHAMVVARALGLDTDVELEPSGPADPLLARMTLTAGTAGPGAEQVLQAVAERRTDRRHTTSWPVPEARTHRLAVRASGWGAHVVAVSDVADRFRLDALVEQAGSLQAADPRFVEEQQAWTGHSRSDGIAATTAVPPRNGRPPEHPNRFEASAPPSTGGASGADGVIALCSVEDDRGSWLRCGQALSALWLQAAREGLSIVPLSQVVEVDETRAALQRDVLGGLARPQVVVRVAWPASDPEPLERTPRRPVGQVIQR